MVKSVMGSKDREIAELAQRLADRDKEVQELTEQVKSYKA
jgi:hypothetical protein